MARDSNASDDRFPEGGSVDEGSSDGTPAGDDSDWEDSVDDFYIGDDSEETSADGSPSDDSRALHMMHSLMTSSYVQTPSGSWIFRLSFDGESAGLLLPP